MSCVGCITKDATTPSEQDIQNKIQLCISTIYCDIWSKRKVGLSKSVESGMRTLKLLYVMNNINIWTDIGDDFDKLYCQMPECL